MSDDTVHPAEAQAPSGPPTGNPIAQAWLVLLLALGFGGALAWIDISLGPRIEANRENAAKRQLPDLIPGAVDGARLEEPVEGITVYRAVDADGDLAGWMLRHSGAGYADRIEVVIGLDAAAATITGLAVIDQKETPTLGDKIQKGPWADQFAGLVADAPVVVVQGAGSAENEITVISGATISSEAVSGIVNDALSPALREALAQRAAATDDASSSEEDGDE